MVIAILLAGRSRRDFPGAAQTVHRVLPAADRPRGFGLLFTGSSVGGMLAPPIATVLYDLAGWRVAFLGTAAIGLAWIPLWIWLTRPTDVAARLDDEEELAPTKPTPIPIGELVRDPLVLRALAAIFATAPVLGLATVWAAKYLVRAHHLDQGDVGFYLWVPPLALDVGAILFGDLAARQRRALGAPPRMLFVLAGALAASIALLPLATDPWIGVAIFAAASAGGGALYALITADVLGRVPSDAVSSVAGVIPMGQSLALVIANPLIGYAVDATGSYDLVAYALAAWFVPGALLWLAWRPAARLAGDEARRRLAGG